MAQVWVDIKPGVLDDITLLSTWDTTPTVSDLGGGQYAIVVDETNQSTGRALVYDLISDVTNSDQIEVYAELKVTSFNDTTEFNLTAIGCVAQAEPVSQWDNMSYYTRWGETCVLFDEINGSFNFTSGGITSLAAVNNKHKIRLRVEASNYLGKAWNAGDTEPVSFQVTRSRPTLAQAGKSGVGIYSGVTMEITALSFGTDGDSAPTESIAVPGINITNIKEPNELNTLVTGVSTARVKVWHGASPVDTGAEDVLLSNQTITNGEIEFAVSGSSISDSAIAEIMWIDGSERNLVITDATIIDLEAGT